MDKCKPNRNYVAIKKNYELFSKNFAASIRTELMVSFHLVWLWNKVKGFDLFNVIRLKGEVDFLTGKFLEVFYFPCALVIIAKVLKRGFWEVLFLSMCF